MDVRTFEAHTMNDAVKAVKKALGADAVILSTREKGVPGGKGKTFEVTAAAAVTSRRTGAAVQAKESPAPVNQAVLEALSARVAQLTDDMPTRAQVQALEAGMESLKLLLLEALRAKDGSPLKDLPAALVPLDRQLRAMGVDDVQIADLMKHLRALPPPGEEPGDYFRDQAIRWLMKRVKIAPRWPVLPGAVSYQALVGPTGVGKSGLIAKLAALYHIRERHSVAVVSFDNHRLAASEQMRIFCKIIGVPFVAAASPGDVARVTETHKNVELVLVDTAGLSAKNPSGIAELRALKDAGAAVDFHLCLSVTDKGANLDQSIRAFAPLGIQSLAFTKLDESWSYGEIYNLARKWALPLSFFSIGQQIPDDIERATRERVVERIFGL